jgi:YesN/AraC family two-component response regulator
MTNHSALIINSGVPYHILTPESSVRYILVNYDYTQSAAHLTTPIKPVAKEKFTHDMLVDFKTFEDVTSLSRVIYIKKLDNIQAKLTVIVNEYMQKLLYYEEKTGHLFAECLTDCIRFSQIGNTASEDESSKNIISYIHEHYMEGITNCSIGELFGYHPNYVSALIKKKTGMPVHQYIIYVRLLNAASLLENTALSVNEIAISCGFYDIAYFSKYFKKYFGVSPSEYRQF